MSTTNALESNEDLENVPLVRMEDVQPARDRNCDIYKSELQDEVVETCIVDNVDYESECVVNDDEDSNIGSMVSIQSEEVVCCEDSNSAELIVPEVLEPTADDNPIKLEQETKMTETKANPPDSWPTLEILPGGVIKHADKCEDDLSILYPNVEPETAYSGEMMYACAKCSQSFKYLFCLVKHVKWHEDQKKKERGPNLEKLTIFEKEMVYIKRARNELEKSYKKQKIDVLARIADAIGKIGDVENNFNK